MLVDTVLAQLAVERPVFHSEADFQHALAWLVHRHMPDARIRLETHPAPGVRLDLLITSGTGSQCTAIELKYLTRSWAGEVNGEHFALKSQGAQDIRAYDVVKDIARVEADTHLLPACDGLVVVLCNDQAYWTTPGHDRDTNAAAFRLYEGRTLAGTCDWGPNTGPGTKRGRESPITLHGSYSMHWRDYSRAPGPAGQFRALTVEVPSPDFSADQSPQPVAQVDGTLQLPR